MSINKRYYFDTNALFKHYISKETAIRRLSSSTAVVYVSNLTHLEVLGVLMRYLRQGKLRKRQIDSILDQLKRDIGTTSSHRFQLVATQEGVFRNARKLIIEYAMIYELSTNDALHIAIAKTITPGVIMVTSDGGKSFGKMKGVCTKIGLEVFDPEISSQS